MEILSRVNLPLLRRFCVLGRPILRRHGLREYSEVTTRTTVNIADCPLPALPQASHNVITQAEILSCLVPLYSRGWEIRLRKISSFDGTKVATTEGKVLLRPFSFNSPQIALKFIKDLVSLIWEEKPKDRLNLSLHDSNVFCNSATPDAVYSAKAKGASVTPTDLRIAIRAEGIYDSKYVAVGDAPATLEIEENPRGRPGQRNAFIFKRPTTEVTPKAKVVPEDLDPLPPLPSIPSPLMFLQEEDYEMYLGPMRSRGWKTANNMVISPAAPPQVKTFLKRLFEFKDAETSFKFIIAAAEIALKISGTATFSIKGEVAYFHSMTQIDQVSNISLRDIYIAMCVEELARSMGAYKTLGNQAFPSNPAEMELYRQIFIDSHTETVAQRALYKEVGGMFWKLAQDRKAKAKLPKKSKSSRTEGGQ